LMQAMASNEPARGRPWLREVFDRVCVGQNIGAFASTKKFRCFRTNESVKYFGFCDDFGPMSFGSIVRFIDLMDTELQLSPQCKIVYSVEDGRRNLSNAVFLLGAFMILKLDCSLDEVCEALSWINDDIVEHFRDATFTEPPTFRLTIQDCWGSLIRAKELKWIEQPQARDQSTWGLIDADDYLHWDNPFNGDLHMVVPGKFVAFKGPSDLGDEEYADEDDYRRFGPKYYVDIFKHLGVTDVIRLNEPEYNAADFVTQDILHHDLYFEDCTTPTQERVDKFFEIVDNAKGIIAVHCKAGLGRTGTLIALHMMRTQMFTAREAMAWLRIMRPGSVIGVQQHYLCSAEIITSEGESLTEAESNNRYTWPTKTDASQVLADQVFNASIKRCSSASAHMRLASNNYFANDIPVARAANRSQEIAQGAC